LTSIRGHGSLAIPELRLPNDHSGVRKAVCIHTDFRQAVLISEALHFRRDQFQDFGKRRMLGIEPQIELLQVTYSSADVSRINGDGLAQGGRTRQDRHAQEQQASEKGGEIPVAGPNGVGFEWLIGVPVSLVSAALNRKESSRLGQ